jgi:hypothetical protein
MLDSKLYFRRHVDFVYSEALRALGLIRYVTYNYTILYAMLVARTLFTILTQLSLLSPIVQHVI